MPRVAACAKNQLGPSGTIPEELKAAALAIARWRCLSRLPGMKSLQDEARRAEYSDALALLSDVAACKFALTAPAEPIAADIGSPVAPDVGDPRTCFSPEKFDGT